MPVLLVERQRLRVGPRRDGDTAIAGQDVVGDEAGGRTVERRAQVEEERLPSSRARIIPPRLGGAGINAVG